MKYNAVNEKLALIEDAILNDKVDQFISQDSISNIIIKMLGSSGISSTSEIAQSTETIVRLLKTKEFKEVLRTNEFQFLYKTTHILPPLLHGGVQEFYGLNALLEIGNTKAWKSLISLRDFQNIEEKINFAKLANDLIFSDWIANAIFNSTLGLKQGGLKQTNQLFSLSFCFNRNPENVYDITIEFKLFDKTFDLDLNLFSQENIKYHLKKHLINSNYKSKIIHDTISFSRELVNKTFIEGNESRFVLFCLTSLYDFIFEKECAVLNYFIEQKQNNSSIYQSLIVNKISAYLALDKLFLFYVSSGSRIIDIRNFYNNNFAAIWKGYEKMLMEESETNNNDGIAKRLESMLDKSFITDEKSRFDNNQESLEKIDKKKLPCYNYLFAALLHEKARKCSNTFLTLCREASKEWLDRNGKEFTGEQLANNFHNTVKKCGGWPEFFSEKEEQIENLKRNINWQY